MNAVWQALPVANVSSSCLSSPILENLTLAAASEPVCAYKVPSILIAQICCTYYVQQIQDECTFTCAHSQEVSLRTCLSSASNDASMGSLLQIRCSHNQDFHGDNSTHMPEDDYRTQSTGPPNPLEDSAHSCINSTEPTNLPRQPHSNGSRASGVPSRNFSCPDRVMDQVNVLNLQQPSSSCTPVAKKATLIVLACLVAMLQNG